MSAAADGQGDRGKDEPDDTAPGAPSAPPRPDLREALRTARLEEAERSRAIADLRGAALARLEMLKARLEPVLAQVPAGVDLFDAAVMPVPHPRLFIDMIGFVEMAHDRRSYRFIQDRREGRVVLCESERLDVVAAAVTAYIARRLIEREKALAGEAGAAMVPPAPAATPWRSPPWLRTAGRVALEYLGLAALIVLVWTLGHALYQWAIGLHR